MSINVNFYSFSKRENSTKRPSSGATTYSCNLKDPTSIINPVFTLDANSMVGFNYCYIADFDRYYYITDIISIRNLMWEVHCKVDALASWKDTINSSSQYVLRSASSKNSYIKDSLYQLTVKKSYTGDDFIGSNSIFSSNSGCYVLGVINGQTDSSSPSKIGGVTYYVLSASDLKTLMDSLVADYSYLDDNVLYGITKAIIKELINPMSCITMCIFLPYDLRSLMTTPYIDNGKVICGRFLMPGFASTTKPVIQASAISHKITVKVVDYTLPNHPQQTRGAYMNAAPFTERILRAGPFGDITINNEDLIYNNTALRLRVEGDFLGNCRLTVSGVTSGAVVYQGDANVAVPIKISQISDDRLGLLKSEGRAVSSGISMASGMMEGDPSGVMGAFPYASAQMDMLGHMPHTISQGSQGSFNVLNHAWRMDNYFTYAVDDAPNLYGSPLCEIKTLNTLSGFVVVKDPSIALPATKTEIEEVRGYLASGTFLE